METSNPQGAARRRIETPWYGGDNGGGKDCQVWAIGGGKGGTGKSFITSSLGIAMASRGKKVILLDADLGGANLHTFLGIKRPQRTLTEFFEQKISLQELVVDSGIEKLGLVSGDLHTLDTDNVKYVQKLRLFRHIRELDADYVLIDLGAGSHYNTLDIFLLADRTMVVIVPVKTSIENMYHFVKNVFFRRLKISSGKEGLRDAVMDAWKNRKGHGIRNLRELVDYVRQSSPGVGGLLEKEASGLTIDIIVNQVKSQKDIPIGSSVKSVFSKYLGVGARFAGYVQYDESIWSCINIGRPLMKAYPVSHCAKQIERLADNLLGTQEVRRLRYDEPRRRL